mmetsp:Transcript_1973/g.3609  ORF Transcript_1973/g.3609 Transcript_1973/m.3609 type:complete len:196 (-) Transcript_1973:117-704(-)
MLHRTNMFPQSGSGRTHSQAGKVSAALMLMAAAGVAMFFGSQAFVPAPSAALPVYAAAVRECGCDYDCVDDMVEDDELGLAVDESVQRASRALNTFDRSMWGPGPGFGTNPVLAEGISMQPPKPGLDAVLAPVTKLFYKYMFSIKPRCALCRIVVRHGKLVRICPVRRHKARQPGTVVTSKYRSQIKNRKLWRPR